MTEETTQTTTEITEETHESFAPTLTQRLSDFVRSTFSYEGNLLIAGLGSLIVVTFYGFTPVTLTIALLSGVVAGTTNYFLHTAKR